MKQLKIKTKKISGFTLFEMLLGFIVIAAIAAGAFKFLGSARVNAQVNQELDAIQKVSEMIRARYLTVDGDFEGISTAGVAGMQGLPEVYVEGGSTLKSSFGSALEIEFNATRPKEFGLRYSGMDTSRCISLIQNAYNITTRISVITDTAGTTLQQVQMDPTFDSTVMPSDAGRLSPTATIVNACSSEPFLSNDGSIILFFGSDDPTDSGLAPPPTACSCTDNQVETTLNPCPVGQVGALTQTRTGSCTGGTADCPTNVWGAWATISNTCAPAPTAPGPSTSVSTPTTPCVPETQTRTIGCPAGLVGSITEAQTSSCATATSTPVWSGTWVETMNTCVDPITPAGSACVPTVVTDASPPSCPTGQCGVITRQKTMVCDSSNNLVAPTPDVWTVVSNTCVDSVIAGCAAAPTCTPSVSSWTEACAFGFTGLVSKEETFTCPDPYGAPVSGGIVEIGNTCTISATPKDACSINPIASDCSVTSAKTQTDVQLWQNLDTAQHWCSRNGVGLYHYAQSDKAATRTVFLRRCSESPSFVGGGRGKPYWAVLSTGTQAAVNAYIATLPAADQTRISAMIATHNANIAAASYPSTGNRSAQTSESNSPEYSCLRPAILATGPAGITDSSFTGVLGNTALEALYGSGSTVGAGSGSSSGPGHDLEELSTSQMIRTGVFSTCSSGCSGIGLGTDGTSNNFQLGYPIVDFPVLTQGFTPLPRCELGNSKYSIGLPSGATTSAPCFFSPSTLVCSVPSSSTPCTIAPNTTFTWTVSGSTCSVINALGGTISDGSVYSASDSSLPTTGDAQFSCSGGVMMATANVGATCTTTVPPPATCDIVAAPYTWTVGSSNCSFTPAAQTIAEGASISLDDITGPDSGSRVLTCSGGTLSTTSQTCSTAASSDCSITAGQEFTWAVGGNSCSFTASAQTVTNGSTVVFTDNLGTTGSAKTTCSSGILSALFDKTCSAPPSDGSSGCGGGVAGSWCNYRSDSNPDSCIDSPPGTPASPAPGTCTTSTWGLDETYTWCGGGVWNEFKYVCLPDISYKFVSLTYGSWTVTDTAPTYTYDPAGPAGPFTINWFQNGLGQDANSGTAIFLDPTYFNAPISPAPLIPAAETAAGKSVSLIVDITYNGQTIRQSASCTLATVGPTRQCSANTSPQVYSDGSRHYFSVGFTQDSVGISIVDIR